MNQPLSTTPCPVHPDRTATTVCPSCGSFACPECMAGEGPTAVCVTCAQSDSGLPPIHMERSAELGVIPAVLETMKGVMLEPGNYWRRHRPPRDTNASLLFLLFLIIPILIGGLLWQLITPMLMAAFAATNAELQEVAPSLMMSTGINVVTTLLLTPIQTFVVITLAAFLHHLFLVLFGGASKDLAATWRVAIYTSAPKVLNAVPLLGDFVALVWVTVCRILGYREIHECSTGQAAGAVLVPWLLCMICCGLATAAIVVAGVSLFENFAP